MVGDDQVGEFLEDCFHRDHHIILTQIFLSLDAKALKNARLTCKKWNQFILKYIWRNSASRAVLERKLAKGWQCGFPSTVLTTRCSRLVSDLACDTKIIVCGLQNGQVEVWDRIEGTLLATLENADSTQNIQVGLNREIIASGFFTKRVTLWRRDDEYSFLRDLDVTSNVYQVRVDGDYIAVSMVNGCINIYKLTPQDNGDENDNSSKADIDVKYIGTITGQPRAANDISVNQGHILTSSFRLPLKLWTLAEAKFIRNVGSYVRKLRQLQLSLPYAVCLHGSSCSRVRPGVPSTVILYDVTKDMTLAKLTFDLATNVVMDQYRLVVATKEDIRIHELSEIKQRAEALSPLSEISVPANLILKSTLEVSDTCCQMQMSKDQLFHQSQPGVICVEDFWMCSMDTERSRFVVSALNRRGSFVEILWWLLMTPVTQIVAFLSRKFFSK